MCGIIGSINTLLPERQFEQSLNDLHNRGPDFQSIYKVDRHIFGHARLAITDLSDDSNQPYISPCGNYLLVFNGQIYNYKFLRHELSSKWDFVSSGDTEVLLAGLTIFNFQFLLKCRGPFSFCLYNRSKNELVIGRDRFGEKPFYYSLHGNNFNFSSTFRSLLGLNTSLNQIDDYSMCHYLNYGFTPNNTTLYKDIKKLNPGFVCSIDCNSGSLTKLLDLNEENEFNISIDNLSIDEITEQYQELLIESMRITYPTDLKPIFFLSGGIDSTLCCASAVKSGFDVEAYYYDFGDSTTKKLVDRISNDLGFSVNSLSHNELYHDEIKKILITQDEPLADRSILFTHQLFKSVVGISKVVIGGDGNDEFSLGYPHYSRMGQVDKFYNAVIILHKIFRMLPLSWIKSSWFENNFFSWILEEIQPVDVYNRHISPYNIFNYTKYSTANVSRTSRSNIFKLNSQLSTANKWDIERYLPDDILFKIDRSSMSHSIESRSPFLDPKLAHYVNNFSMKNFKNYNNKFLSNKVLEKWGLGYVCHLSKQGFVDSSSDAVNNYSNILFDGLRFLPSQIFNVEQILNSLDNKSKHFENKIYIRHLFNLASLGYWYSDVS